MRAKAGLPSSVAGLLPEQASHIRLLVLDIDGTCMDAAGQVSATVRQALRRASEAGLALAVATGRTHQSASDFHALSGSTLPLISYDGALLMTREPLANPLTGAPRSLRGGPTVERREPLAHPPTGAPRSLRGGLTVERRWPLAPARTRALLELVERREWRDQLVAYVHSSGEILTARSSPAASALAEHRGLRVEVVDELEGVLERGADHISIIADSRRPLAEFLAALNQDHGEALSTNAPLPFRLAKGGGVLSSIRPAHADKGRALAHLAEQLLGLQAREVAAIGDGLNDLGMLRYAGLGVAMGQASAPVKAVADAVAPPIEADGVAAVIDALIRVL